MTVQVARLTGEALHAALDDLAALRIAVFAAYPYLYAGSKEYERKYLAEFTASPDAVLVAARDGERIVGAATASPLAAQDDYIREPFARCGIDQARVFYFGESVLLPEYRGQGIGHAFLTSARPQRCPGAPATPPSAPWSGPRIIRSGLLTTFRSTHSGPGAAMPQCPD